MPADPVVTSAVPPVEGGEPGPVDWRTVSLPDGWPDRLRLVDPRDAWVLLRRLFGGRRRVELPPGLPGADRLPAYIGQEFHHLPNGNFSKRIVAGYVRWFDAMMLGRMHTARARVARSLAGCRTVLDVGCGSGGLVGELLAAGVPEVWGLDPSPYLLQIAARSFPAAQFVQGLAEDTGFDVGQFDGIGASFLFHELPVQIADRALREFRRILLPGGVFAFIEPSPLQFRPRELMQFLRSHGPVGLYFWLVASGTYEPFVAKWHRRDLRVWLESNGFGLRGDEVGMPIRWITAERLP